MHVREVVKNGHVAQCRRGKTKGVGGKGLCSKRKYRDGHREEKIEKDVLK